jgi:hypothetical protein
MIVDGIPHWEDPGPDSGRLNAWAARCSKRKIAGYHNAPMLIIACKTVTEAVEKLEHAVQVRRGFCVLGSYERTTQRLEKAIQWLRDSSEGLQ